MSTVTAAPESMTANPAALTAATTTASASTPPFAPAQPLPPLRVSPAQTLRHGLVLAGRGIGRIRRTPDQLADVVLTPILSLLMFVYLFGGAIGGGDVHGYQQMIVPGIMVMTVFQASIGIGVSLNTDAGTGVFDRFRSMPIARSAPLIGAVVADVVRYVVCLSTLVLVALAMGYRAHTNPLAALAGFVLLVGFALSFSWISVWVGMLVKTPASVMGIMTVLILPLTFASNVLVPAKTQPGWLQAWSRVNPISLMSDAMRGLLNGGRVATPLAEALIWMVAVVAVFLPLAMRAYRKNSTV